MISECSGWRPLRQRRASRSLAARVHGKGHLGAPHGRRLGKFGGLRGSGMKTVVSTTSISQSRCPGPRKEPLGTLRVERLRRIVDHSVSGMEIAASATRISMSGCSVSILRRVFLGTLSLERLSRRSLWSRRCSRRRLRNLCPLDPFCVLLNHWVRLQHSSMLPPHHSCYFRRTTARCSRPTTGLASAPPQFDASAPPQLDASDQPQIDASASLKLMLPPHHS